MSPIIPAIIPKSFSELESTCKSVLPFTHEVQVDIVDGNFVPFTSWPYVEGGDVSDLSRLTQTFLIEMDMMVEKPEDTIESYLQAGVRKVVIHLESTTKLDKIHNLKTKYDFRFGISINNDTELKELIDVIQYSDYVQCMGIKEIGTQGQPFDTRVLYRVKGLKQKFPDLIVSVDGSVNFETLAGIVSVGTDRCAVGSALLKSDNMSETYKKMLKIYEENIVM